ncbi:MAG: Smr/MutS family protein [Spirochaetaceae bacterium]|nr:Smr/MutS family protein [Spirochaetaceae bacterium]
MKDFGEILSKWEKKTTTNNDSKKKLSAIQHAWLEKYGTVDKDALNNEKSVLETPARADRIAIDAEIDLHGMTRDEAESALQAFFSHAVRSKYKKVLIIHGKGNHSQGEPVLKKFVQGFLEKNQYAGKSGTEKAIHGGSGATWVMLKTSS